MKKLATLTVLTLMALILSGVSALAQSATVFAGGLKAPVRMILTPGGNLLVAESGTGHMDGRISIIDQSGSRRTLVDGLPSAINGIAMHEAWPLARAAARQGENFGSVRMPARRSNSS